MPNSIFKPKDIVYAINTYGALPSSIHKCIVLSTHIYEDIIEYSLKDIVSNEEWGDTTSYVYSTLDIAAKKFKEMSK